MPLTDSPANEFEARVMGARGWTPRPFPYRHQWRLTREEYPRPICSNHLVWA